MTHVAVTGASGFLARHLIPALLAEGHEVRGLARSAAPDLRGQFGSGFTPVRGDVRNRDAVHETTDGAEWVIHLAASTQADDPVADIIVRGTETVIEASAGARRLTLLSCMGACAASHSAFYRAKWQAEMLVRSSDIPHVILQPSLLLGDGDSVLRPLATMIRKYPVVPVVGSGEGRVQPIEVRDVVRCILITLENDATVGQSFPLGGPMYLTFRQLIDLVAHALGVSRVKLLTPAMLTGSLKRMLPEDVRHLYSGALLAAFEQNVVSSPGIVQRHFGFPASDILSGLNDYLTGALRRDSD
jgi:uncharacterized protein YbjT (DUF2867 family)